jgi:diguanylate cyclase (GGDEF)-like protein
VTTSRAYASARRRPVVFLLVYGAFLVLIGITATALAVMSSSHLLTTVLSSVATADRAVVGTFIESYVQADDLDGAGVDRERYEELEERLRAALERSDFMDSTLTAVEVVNPDGEVIFSSTPGRDGADVPVEGPVAAVLAGTPDVVPDVALPNDWAAASPGTDLIREYLPLRTATDDGEEVTLGAILVARDATPITARVERARTDVILTTLSAAVVIGILLFFIFRAAQGRISRQTEALIESARRDPVTGLLNHGSVVEALAESLDAARPRNGVVATALLDVDNFTLVNDVHGHAAGDELLRRVARLAEHVAEGWTVGRFGPDEFLVVAPDASASRLEGALVASATISRTRASSSASRSSCRSRSAPASRPSPSRPTAPPSCCHRRRWR